MAILVANWKMYGTQAQAREYAFALNAALAQAPVSTSAVFCPPFPLLAAARAALPGNARLELGAQDCHEAPEGSCTGCVSAPILADVGCRYVILGHSERRAKGETDAMVARKAKGAIEAGLMPIICIGESEADYMAKKTAQLLKTQLGALAELPSNKYIVAYEPVWAIGSGKTPKSAEIEAAHAQVKTVLGSATAVLYGGSVKPANAKEILGITGVDGALVGGASREVADMVAILKAA